MFAHDSTGVSWQKVEHVHPEALLPRQATLWNGAGTYWHHAGTELPEWPGFPREGADEFCNAEHAQHSGLFGHDSTGVSWQKLEHVHPEALLPRQATLWNGAGT